jgi:hypothetical protein
MAFNSVIFYLQHKIARYENAILLTAIHLKFFTKNTKLEDIGEYYKEVIYDEVRKKYVNNNIDDLEKLTKRYAHLQECFHFCHDLLDNLLLKYSSLIKFLELEKILLTRRIEDDLEVSSVRDTILQDNRWEPDMKRLFRILGEL